MTYPQTTRAAIVLDYRATQSLFTTGARFGCSPNTVSKFVKEAGEPVRPTGGVPKPPGSGLTLNREELRNGYIAWTAWDSTSANGRFLIYEHRLVVMRELGRALLPDEHVHHLNGDRHDNRIENLAVIDPATHTRLHHLGRPKPRRQTWDAIAADRWGIGQ